MKMLHELYENSTAPAKNGNIGNPTLIRSAFDPFIHCDEVGTQEVNEMISTTAPPSPRNPHVKPPDTVIFLRRKSSCIS